MATSNSKMLAPVTAALLESWEIPAEMRPVRCLPKAKSSVAASSSHGSTRKKVFGGVLMRSNAPSEQQRGKRDEAAASRDGIQSPAQNSGGKQENSLR